MYAEAEAGAAALRRRGVELERAAKQLRSIRAISGAQAASAAAPPTASTPSTVTAPTVSASDAAQIDTDEAAPDRLATAQKDALPPAQHEISHVQQAHGDSSSTAVQPAREPNMTDSHPAMSGPEACDAAATQHTAKLAQRLEEQSQQALPETSVAQQPAQHEQVPAAERSSSTAVQRAAEPTKTADQGPLQGLPSDCSGGVPVTAPGLVVWGSVKGWPPWPGIVLTEEEMDVAGVHGKQGQDLKGTLAFCPFNCS